jgi:hypothetical protein
LFSLIDHFRFFIYTFTSSFTHFLNCQLGCITLPTSLSHNVQCRLLIEKNCEHQNWAPPYHVNISLLVTLFLIWSSRK